MTNMGLKKSSSFDKCAMQYDEQLNRGISLSGEGKDYFAKARVAWLRRRLPSAPASVMDYGCGTGSGIPHIHAQLQPTAIVGVDVSDASLCEARRTCSVPNVSFIRPEQGPKDDVIDLVYSNGTFHHIPPNERGDVMAYLFRVVAPGGWLAIWENNPWNVGTRLVMKRIPFDRDAMPVTEQVLRRIVLAAGFTWVRSDYLFVFPRFLRWLRPLEGMLCQAPFGAQYLVLARKASRMSA